MDQDPGTQRRLVHAVFERRIGRPRPGIEERVLAEIPYDRRPAVPARLAWLAIPVAVALALLMVAGLLATRHAMHQRSIPATSPKTRTTVAPPAFYFIRADQPGVLYGQSWGHDAMQVTPPVALSKTSTRNFGLVSPDGSRFLVGGAIYDQTGTSLGSVPTDKGVIWADDSRHLCWMAPPAGFAGDQGGTGTLMTWQPGESPRGVATLGRFSGQTTASVRACSPAGDRVVVVQNNINRASEAWAVSLSSGAVNMHQAYPADQMIALIGSHDGRYIAENNSTVGSSIVRDTTTGATVPVPGRAVLAFSWDGGLAIVVTLYPVLRSSLPSPLQPIIELRDLRAGRTLWASPAASGQSFRMSARAEPGGSRMLVERFVDGAAEIWMVEANGRAVQVASNASLIL